MTLSQSDTIYLATACHLATLSKAERKKVGAILLTTQGTLIPGVNGQPSGGSNICEDSEGLTKPTTIHAELNCIIRAAKEGISTEGSTVYVSLSPCLSCASMLVQAGVKRVVYAEDYRCTLGVEFLKGHGVEVTKSYISAVDTEKSFRYSPEH